MRLRLAPLATGGDALPLVDDRGARVAALAVARLAWRCRDVDLDLRVLACEPVALPAPEPSEPVAGALARVAMTLRAQAPRSGPALLLLANPARAIGAQAMAMAEGVRLLAIADEADEACWDAALSLGLPLYGVRGACAFEASRADPAAALAALAYGAFTCEDGLAFAALDEDREGARWRLAGDPADAVTTVVVRGGFEAERVAGPSGGRRDRGDEGYVRLIARAGSGACWSQPRFIAPRPSGAARA